ncbi:AtzH-like domain-containing protein [Microbacterium sp. Marseille-Q6965]|uniref:AtzH-like domain-containing protein n=1 Tax=Microbacterium sp. Marseille-Q6965 TaxID=2965072 RepID=UPI0021B847D9|nr:AtzH-like domain-containing protein [Microbacterium sp. Marseille-Q6965]
MTLTGLTTLMPGFALDADGPLPEGLLDAFDAYERALAADDVDALDDAFEDSDFALRGDGTQMLRGREAISSFRSARGGIPRRTVQTLHVRPLGDDAAVVIAMLQSPSGARGQQTHVWRRRHGMWRIVAAHVSSTAAKPIDATVWVAAGDPLIAPTRSGELDGVTVAVKDLFEVAGLQVGAGVPAFRSAQPRAERHAPAVGRLLDAGAAVVGIAHSDQFAYSLSGINSHYGTPMNPAAPDRIPGGSSSGPAVAVSRGQASVGLGTDTAGSVRVPASYQGLWGLRTSHGAVPLEGVVPLAPSFDAVGWITREGALLERIAGTMLPDSATMPLDDAEVVSVSVLSSLASTPVRSVFEDEAARIGARPLDVELPLEEWFAAFRTLQAWEAWQTHGAWIAAHPGSLGADVAARFAAAAQVSEADAAAARAVVAEARSAVRALLARRILVLPSTANPPVRLDAVQEAIDADRADTLRLTFLASLAGLPALSAPLLRVDGLPVGLGFVGPAGSDAALVRRALDLAPSRTAS